MLCLVAQSCLTLCNPQTVANPAPLAMGFSRQEFCSGLPCPSPGDLPNPRTEPRSPALQLHFCLKNPCILGINPTWLWCVSFLMCHLILFARIAIIVIDLHILKSPCVCWSLSNAQLFVTPWSIPTPGSSVHGDSPDKNTGVVARSSFRGSSWPRDQIHIPYVSCISRWVLYH